MVAEEYHVPKERCYTSAEEMLKEEKLADVMFITTQDRQHVAQAIPALRKGYHLLLEKPISPDLDECREIVEVAKECDRKVVVCHVLRYTPVFRKVKGNPGFWCDWRYCFYQCIRKCRMVSYGTQFCKR